ncbi:MAG: response regulator [Desulfobacterales bacterium]|nr:response regulator [Desulfobacterales bacterium]
MARILVIDDHVYIRDVLRQALERFGYDVLEAPDGEVGVRLYQEEPTDLVITGIIMPEKDGIEVIKELRREFADVKIIVLSASGRLLLAKKLGAQRIFDKPFRLKEVLEAVKDLLGA